MESHNRVDRFLVALLALSLVVNVAVVWWAVKGRSAAPPPDVTVGETLPSITGVSVDGKPMTVSYNGQPRPTVLYVFSPTCTWCERNLENIRTLSKSAGDKYQFVGVSLPAAVKERTTPFNFPVVFANGQTPFRGTPQTLVVGADGKVLQSWKGAYAGSTKQQIESFFKTQLPGLDVRSTNGGAS